MDSLQIIDYIFLTIVLFSALFGFARGFLSEAFTILNVTIAATATYYLFPYNYQFFFKHINNEAMVLLFSTLVVYLFFWVITGFVTRRLDRKIEVFGNNFADRLLGTVFGLIRGLLVCIVIYMGVVSGTKAYQDDTKLPEWMLNARSHNFIKMQTEYFLKFMPKQMQEIYKNGTDSFAEEAYDSISQKLPITEFEKKLDATGIKLKNIKTLREIVREMPNSFEYPYTFPELAELDVLELQEYIPKLLDGYENQIKLGKIESELSASDIQSLRQNIESLEVGDKYDENGLY